LIETESNWDSAKHGWSWIDPDEQVATQCRPGNANFAVDLVKILNGIEPPILTLIDQIICENHHDVWPCSTS
jgi:hypothetical protein